MTKKRKTKAVKASSRKEAIDRAIAQSRQKISKREASLIHRLLKGRRL